MPDPPNDSTLGFTRHWTQVNRWMMQHGPSRVELGSPLDDDDAGFLPTLSPRVKLSSEVHLTLQVALDHLGHVAATKARGDESVFAAYTVLRGALFASCRAVFVLAPTDRDTRMINMLWLIKKGLEHAQLTTREMHQQFPLPAHQQQMRHFAPMKKGINNQLRSLGFTDLSRAAGPDDTSIVAGAIGSLAATEGSDPDLLRDALMHWWRVMSGYAHAHSWALHLTAETITRSGSSGFQQNTSNLLLATDLTAKMTSHALDLWDRRRRVASAHPALFR